MNTYPLIQVRHLNQFYGSTHAIQDISFELNKGEVLGLLGPNGAGKSTTMRILSGNLAAQTGDVLINGSSISRDPVAAKGKIGYLPEIPPLYPQLSVQEFLRFAANLHGMKNNTIHSAIDRVCERCGLQQLRHTLIRKISKGYQQRVGIAQAILHEPDIILLDEPTIGLDPNQIIVIRELISELGNDHGIILSSHILPEIEMVCSRVLILNQGQVVFSDRVKNLSHKTGERLLLEFRNEPDLNLCCALPGVIKAERISACKIRIQHSPSITLVDEIARLTLENGWGLLQITPEHKSLEQIFIELTCKEPGKDPGKEHAA